MIYLWNVCRLMGVIRLPIGLSAYVQLNDIYCMCI